MSEAIGVPRAGFVLAGGASSRMGRDKALLPYRGSSLLEHVAGQVRQAAGSVAIIGPRRLYGDLGPPVFEDLHPGCGPLGGIEAALSASAAEWNLVVACDMPGVTAEFLRCLLEHAEESGADAMAADGGRGLEPLCACYRRACLPAIRQAIQSKAFKLADALAGVRLLHWPVEEAVLVNLNTPQDWDRYQAAHE